MSNSKAYRQHPTPWHDRVKKRRHLGDSHRFSLLAAGQPFIRKIHAGLLPVDVFILQLLAVVTISTLRTAQGKNSSFTAETPRAAEPRRERQKDLLSRSAASCMITGTLGVSLERFSSMTLWTVAILVFILNVPFGYWRSRSRRFSRHWFLAVHLPVPGVIAFRIFAGLGWHLVTFPVLVGAFFLGQAAGTGLHRAFAGIL